MAACPGPPKKCEVYKVPVKRLSSYNINKACAHLRAKAGTTTRHLCATFVKNAMAAGGAPYIGGLDGVDVWKECAQYGFTRVNLTVKGKTVIGALKGDIASMGYKGHKCGHTAMFDGKDWISYYNLHANCIPYSAGAYGISFWRWTDGLSSEPYFVDSPGGGSDDNYSSDNYNYQYSDGGNNSVSSEYYVDPNATTFSGAHNNLFNEAEANAFTIASLKNNIDTSSTIDTTHTRIYSTNDAAIVLDVLSMPVDSRQSNSSTNT